MTRGNNRGQVFNESEDYEYFLTRLELYKAAHPFNLYHYCLMPNHTHLLIQTDEAVEFAKFMKKLNLSYVHYYRRKYGWVGHFWQDRYKAQPVGKDEYFIQCGKYIELNPVRSLITKNPEDYLYSSYSYYSTGKSNSLLTEDMFYKDLGDTQVSRQKKYTKMIVDEVIIQGYKQKVWAGSRKQAHNENEKNRYHLKQRK